MLPHSMRQDARCPAGLRHAGALRLAVAALALCLATACVPIAGGALQRHASVEVDEVPLQSTTIGRTVAARSEASGESACTLLGDGRDAWLHRVALIEMAERSIDLQYYIYERDASGLALMYRAVLAADRGVRVRVLLDDSALSTDDLALAALATHSKIEVRVFNAYRNRLRGTRYLELLADFERLQRRMHQKLLVVDGAAAISGGRNIGDNYFDADRETNFEDVDLLVQGKAAAESRRSFDDYWNSPFAVPAAALVAEQPDAARLESGRQLLAESFQRATGGEEKFQAAVAPVMAELRSSARAIWAPVRVLADSPEKVDPDSNLGSPLLDEIQLLMAEARTEVLLASAYLVPRKEGVLALRETREAGVRVALVTNSLAATDVPVVHAGYVKYRHRMLEHDIELYEYRPSHDLPRLKGEKKRERSRASLHTKSLVVDRRLAWIGSFNLDPRSALLNTELAFVVDSTEIAAQLADRITRAMAPDRAWRLALGPHGLQWTGLVDGEEVTSYADPNTSWFMRAGVTGLSFLPGIDNLL